MSKVILFYSYSGKTKKLAAELAEKEGAELIEIKESKKRSPIGTVIPGVFQAMGMKASKIVQPDIDLNMYDEIVIAGPIWAGHAAPAVNAIIDMLPQGKQVTLILLSGGSGYDPASYVDAIKNKDCVVKETLAPVNSAS